MCIRDRGRVAALGGFGAKSAEHIAQGVRAYARHSERVPIGRALPVAEQIVAELAAAPSAMRVELAGSLRRREESVGEIDLVAASDEPRSLIEAFAALPVVERVVSSSEDEASVELHDGVLAALHVVRPADFGAAMLYQTGNREHVARLGDIALERGMQLGGHGLATAGASDTATPLDAPDERDVYAALGLDVPPPEIRWGAEEIELAAEHRLPDLVVLADVRADLQSHSTYTDGRNTLAENRQAAAALGYEYFAATDHALNLRMVGGLDVATVRRQWAEIDELNASDEGPLILKGIELNIADDGSVDYDEDILSGFDIVLASLHSGWDQSESVATERLLAAIRNPWVDVIAHPTGRVIGRRDPIRLDMDAILSAAGECGTIMEINSYPDRLDLPAQHVRLARRYGVRFSLGTDAHAAEQFAHMRYGVAEARRGMVQPSELLNAQPWDIARTWLKRARLLGWS
jgi:DNA polymerase (family 10)